MMNMMITAVVIAALAAELSNVERTADKKSFIEMDKKHTGESVIVSLPKLLY